MADVAISYSTKDRAQALAIVQALHDHGLSVWIDNALELGRDDMDLGVPAGQRHWDVISEALDEASVTLVLDSPNWRRSSYCREEYDHALATGSRVAILPLDSTTNSERAITHDMPLLEATWPVEGIEDLAQRVGDGSHIVNAHSRLLVRSKATPPKWWNPDLRRTRRDARLLAESDLGTYGLSISPPISRVIQSAESAGRRRGRVVFSAVVIILFLLVLEASISVVGYSQAGAALAEAEVEASFQSSLDLARQSQRATGTSDALALADSAASSYPTDTATSASLQAALRARERSRFRIDLDGTAYAAAVPDDGTALVVLEIAAFQSDLRLWTFDGLTGAVVSMVRMPSDLAVNSQLSIAPDGEHVAMFTTDGRTLVRVNSRTGSAEEWAVEDQIVGLEFLADGALVAATNQGVIYRVPADRAGSDALAAAHDTGLTLRGFTAFNDRKSVAYLTDMGVLHRSDIESGEFVDREDPVIQLFEGPPPRDELEGSGSWETRDLLYSCGGDYFVAERVDAMASWVRGQLKIVPSLGNRLSTTSINLQSGSCADGVLVTATPGASEARSYPAGLPIPTEMNAESFFNRMVLAASGDGSTLGIVRQNGIVDLVDVSEAGTSRDMGAAVVVLPFGESDLVVDEEGFIARITHDQPQIEAGIGRTPFPVVWDFVLLADHYVVAGHEGLVSVFEDGRTEARLAEIRGRIGLCGDGVVCAASHKSVVLYGASFQETVDLSAVLGEHESVYEVHGVDERSWVVGTTSGRLLLIDRQTHEELGHSPSSVDGVIALATAPEKGHIYAIGPDGVLSVFDRGLHLLRRRLVGPPGFGIRTACDDSLLILAFHNSRDVLLVDAETLSTVSTIPLDHGGAETFTGTPGACREVVGLSIDRRRNADEELETESHLLSVPIGLDVDAIKEDG